jgi:restriction system protein
MPTPTPFQIDYASLIVKPFFQGILNSVPMLLEFWYVWLIFILIGIAVLGIKIYKQIKLSKSGIFEIDQMTGEDFEERLKILFTNLGYKANRTSKGQGVPDYGADLVIEKDGIKTVVQAKRWRRDFFVGEDAVRAAYSAKNYYNCTEALVVTNTNFSNMAWNLAKVNNVKLWNRPYLIRMLLEEKNSKPRSG